LLFLVLIIMNYEGCLNLLNVSIILLFFHFCIKIVVVVTNIIKWTKCRRHYWNCCEFKYKSVDVTLHVLYIVIPLRLIRLAIWGVSQSLSLLCDCSFQYWIEDDDDKRPGSPFHSVLRINTCIEHINLICILMVFYCCWVHRKCLTFFKYILDMENVGRV